MTVLGCTLTNMLVSWFLIYLNSEPYLYYYIDVNLLYITYWLEAFKNYTEKFTGNVPKNYNI